MAAVLLVSCVSVTDGFAQGRNLRPLHVPLSDARRDAQLCHFGRDAETRKEACDRLERSRSQSSWGTSLEANVKDLTRDTPGGRFLCGEGGSAVCDFAEGTAEKIDAVTGRIGGALGAAEGVVGGALGMVGGALDTLGDTLGGALGTVTGTNTPAEAPRSRPAESVEELHNEAPRPLPRGVDREQLKAELEALKAEDPRPASRWEQLRAELETRRAREEDTKRMLEEAKEDWSVATEEANTTHQEHRASQGEFEQERLRIQAQRNERATGLDYARSRTRTADRNIEYAEKEYRAASQDYGRALAASYPSAGGGGTVETVLRTLSGTGSSGGSGMLGLLSGGGRATRGFDGAASMSGGDDFFLGLDCEAMVATGGVSMSDCQEAKAVGISEGLLNSDGSFLSPEEYDRLLEAEVRDSLLSSGGGGGRPRQRQQAPVRRRPASTCHNPDPGPGQAGCGVR